MARREYELTDEQVAKLLDASKPVPAMWSSQGQYLFGTPQDNALRAWQALSEELGFDYMTAQPVPGKPQKFFTAEPIDHTPRPSDSLTDLRDCLLELADAAEDFRDEMRFEGDATEVRCVFNARLAAARELLAKVAS